MTACEVCHKRLVRKEREKPYAFRARRTCGKSCAIKLHRPKSRWGAMPAEERFWLQVDKTATCWIWTGARCGPARSIERDGNVKRYGSIHINGRPRKAHRFSWELVYGAIPDGLKVLHKCDNPPCVRPDHLFLGTDKENTADAFTKGRRPYRLTDEELEWVRAVYDVGASVRGIAQYTGIAKGVVEKAAKGEYKFR